MTKAIMKVAEPEQLDAQNFSTKIWIQIRVEEEEAPIPRLECLSIRIIWKRLPHSTTSVHRSTASACASCFPSKQRDQIGRFLNVLGKKLSYENSPNFLWMFELFFKQITFLWKTCLGYFFGNFWKQFGYISFQHLATLAQGAVMVQQQLAVFQISMQRMTHPDDAIVLNPKWVVT